MRTSQNFSGRFSDRRKSAYSIGSRFPTAQKVGLNHVVANDDVVSIFTSEYARVHHLPPDQPVAHYAQFCFSQSDSNCVPCCPWSLEVTYFALHVSDTLF